MRRRKDGSVRMRRSATSLEEYQWEVIRILASQNRSVREILDLVQNPKNERMLDQVRYRLSEGDSLQEILRDSRDPVARGMSSYMDVLPAPEALAFALQGRRMAQRMRSRAVESLAYPAGMFLFAYGILTIFVTAVLPSLEMISESAVLGIMRGIWCGLTGTLLLGGAAALALLIGRGKGRQRSSRKMRLPFHRGLCTYLSWKLSLVLAEFQKYHLSTGGMLQAMENSADNSLRKIAGEIRGRLEKGDSLMEALRRQDLDARFLFLAKTGMETGTFERSMREYAAMAEEEIRGMAKRGTGWMQACLYIGIGIVTVLVYQAMLSPLDMLEML